MAKENPKYRDILNEAVLTYPDGAPIAKLQRKRNNQEARRVAGPDFMKLMFKATDNGTISRYFYGSKDETLEALKSTC